MKTAVWGVKCFRTGSKTLERRPSRAPTFGVLLVIFCQIGCVQKAFIPATKCYTFPMTVRTEANCLGPGRTGRTLILNNHYLLAHDVHVDPFQHGSHEQNEGEEPKNGECVGVEAIVIGHIIAPRSFSLVGDKRALKGRVAQLQQAQSQFK